MSALNARYREIIDALEDAAARVEISPRHCSELVNVPETMADLLIAAKRVVNAARELAWRRPALHEAIHQYDREARK